MNRQPPRWQTFDFCRLQYPASRDPLVSSLRIGKVWHFWEGRNAWYGTRAQRYDIEVAFQPTFEHLRPAIEASRKQGSNFRAHELPTLVVAAKSRALVLVDADRPIPFYGAADQKILSTRMYSLARDLLRNHNYAVWEVAPPPAAEVAPFVGYRSQFAGASLPIDWVPENEPIDLSELTRLLSAYSAQ
jgi:hypothetical protein